MKKLLVLLLIVLFSSVSAFATKLRNDSGRWLQVDCYDSAGDAFDTMNMRAGDNDPIPAEAKKIKIRVNGNSISVNGKQIVITKKEDLIIEQK